MFAAASGGGGRRGWCCCRGVDEGDPVGVVVDEGAVVEIDGDGLVVVVGAELAAGDGLELVAERVEFRDGAAGDEPDVALRVGGDAFGITPCIAGIGDGDGPVVGDSDGGSGEVVGDRGKDGLERRGRWLEIDRAWRRSRQDGARC